MTAREQADAKIFHSCDIDVKEYPPYVGEWYRHLRANKMAASSCKLYLNRIFDFMLELRLYDVENISPDMITAASVEEYLLSKQYKTDKKTGQKVPTSTSLQQGIWITMNDFLDFMHNRNYISENYIKSQGIKKPKLKDQVEHIHLTKKDFKKIISSLEIKGRYNAAACRDKAIFLLFMTTGMRRGALTQLDITNFNIEDGMLADNVLTSVIDKGEKHHEYLLTSQTIKAINDWLDFREEYLSDPNEQALFINKQGKRVTDRYIYNEVNRICEKALGYKLSPHKFRSAFITIMVEETGDILATSEAVGHSDVRTTQRYVAENGRGKRLAAKIMEDI